MHILVMIFVSITLQERTPSSAVLFPWESDVGQSVQEAGWTPNPVQSSAENLAPQRNSILEPFIP